MARSRAARCCARPRLLNLPAGRDRAFRGKDPAEHEVAEGAWELALTSSRTRAVSQATLYDPEEHLSDLSARFEANKRKLGLETLDAIASDVERALAAESKELGENAVELRNRIENVFREFIRRWPAESCVTFRAQLVRQ